MVGVITVYSITCKSDFKESKIPNVILYVKCYTKLLKYCYHREVLTLNCSSLLPMLAIWSSFLLWEVRSPWSIWWLPNICWSKNYLSWMLDCLLRLLEEYIQPDNAYLNMSGLSIFQNLWTDTSKFLQINSSTWSK